MFRKINPTQFLSNDASELATFLITNKIQFVEKSKIYNDRIQTSHNLCIDLDFHKPGFIRYYVIAEKDKVLGFGAFSKARPTLGYIDIDVATHNITFTPDEKITLDEKMALRVQNTKSAQENHIKNKTTYSHDVAVSAYKNSLPFTFLGFRPPIEVKKNYGKGLFSKSYSLMKRCEGQDVDKESMEYILKQGNDNPSTAMMVKDVLLPIVKAYKRQIANINYVHRDIKSANVRAKLSRTDQPIINFLDLDSALPINNNDSAYGSPGFLAPELFPNFFPNLFDATKTLKVAQARDIFGLGVLLTGCLNPELDPNFYFGSELGITDGWKVIQAAFNLLTVSDCYDPASMGFQPNSDDDDDEIVYKDLFIYTEDHDLDVTKEQDEIRQLLKDMTNIDPSKRPEINDVITKLTLILGKLELAETLTQHVTKLSPL